MVKPTSIKVAVKIRPSENEKSIISYQRKQKSVNLMLKTD